MERCVSDFYLCCLLHFRLRADGTTIVMAVLKISFQFFFHAHSDRTNVIVDVIVAVVF